MQLTIFTKKIFLLYNILKIIFRVAINIFCRKIIINKPEMLKEKGPLLLACNHPNSFLDSVIMDTLFDKPIWSLARGDAFANSFLSRILSALKILPVYRTSEGVENLSENYRTFEACLDIFKKNGVVLIFSEGRCINEWHLRPLKKGTARLAMKSWEENIQLKVLPVGINYNSFSSFGKNVFINLGTTINKNDFDWTVPDGLRHQSFNNLLQQQLQELVFEIDKKDKEKQKELLELKPSLLKKALFLLPAAIGWLIHAPLFWPIKKTIWKKTIYTDHYDSIMTALLVFVYPFYLLIIVLLLFVFTKSWWVFLLLLILPFTAWAYVQIKGQLDH